MRCFPSWDWSSICFKIYIFMSVTNSVHITKVIDTYGYLCKLQKNFVYSKFLMGPNKLFQPTLHETSCITKNFICQFYDKICIDFLAFYIFVMIYTFVFLRFFLVLRHKLLTNLQSILKIDFLAKKVKDNQLTKMVSQMVSIHVTSLLCYWH